MKSFLGINGFSYHGAMKLDNKKIDLYTDPKTDSSISFDPNAKATDVIKKINNRRQAFKLGGKYKETP